MPQIDHNAIGQVFGPFFLWFFFIFGLIGLAVGAGLAVRGREMARSFEGLNRWVSTQRKLSQRWVGALFIAGGAYPLFMLVGLHNGGLGMIGTRGGVHGQIIAWSVEATWWFLTVGNLLAIFLGALLLFFPRTLDSLGSRTGQGAAQAGGGETQMYLTLDRLVVSHPRLAGSLVAAGAFFVVLQFGLVLFGANR